MRKERFIKFIRNILNCKLLQIKILWIKKTERGRI